MGHKIFLTMASASTSAAFAATVTVAPSPSPVVLTSGGLCVASELFCHYCGTYESREREGFAVYGCNKCMKFYMCCKDNLFCPRACLNCQGVRAVAPFQRVLFDHETKKD